MILRELGPALYDAAICWPHRLIVRAIAIERQRDAAQKLAHLRLMALADHMEAGREYVRGKDDPKPKPTDGYYSLKRFQSMEEALENLAEPWAVEFKKEQKRKAREAEQAAKWERAKAAFRGVA